MKRCGSTIGLKWGHLSTLNGNPLEAVALKIVERYSHPGRTAYLYLFQLPAETDFAPLIPNADVVIAAWMDEGDKLSPSPADTAVALCRATKELAPNLTRPQKLSSQQRKQMMARSILFSVRQLNE